MVDFTVAIPTYNGEFRLPDVLEQLRSQLHTETLSWEVIVVDNNSQDRTANIVRSFQANFPCPLRYSLETQQGSAYARQRGIQEAQSDLIGFLDDDNVPDSNWVVAAYQFAQTHPEAGAFGSLIQGDFEVEPPQEFKRILPFLAITERGSKPLCYQSQKKLLPPSAGLVVRKKVWLDNVPKHPVLIGRVGKDMLAGEDTEVLSYIQQAGWEIWYNPDMKVLHKIPVWRFEKAYLIRLFRGIGLSRHVTRTIGVKPWQRSILFLAYMANDLRKIILHLVKYRTQIKTNLVVACEMELFVSSLMSPIYLWRKGYLNKRKRS
ncbi:MAG: glycosyltransferase family 2 protein [Cyanobacteria bacterium CRU_2_1]|nr:glycosyltransferase family 2 protein [Cyanobacteria bacterium RU_5_0]NJR59045.1 glycosyltransferase family 2 protein [Cyanobacteria bacterium CRU_2_1]